MLEVTCISHDNLGILSRIELFQGVRSLYHYWKQEEWRSSDNQLQFSDEVGHKVQGFEQLVKVEQEAERFLQANSWYVKRRVKFET